jgi:ZIP family zinc transporter
MATWFAQLDAVAQALIAGGFTWLVTTIGAATVVLSRRMPKGLLDAILGFAAGVMLAASFWSLLAPAIDLAEQQGRAGWFPASAGFLAGAAFLRLVDQLLPHLHPGLPLSRTEGPKTTWQRSTLLVLAITLHNIPEGLAVGVAFGGIGLGSTLAAALALTVGIGLQNFPEGMAVALPLRQSGMSRWRSFWYGQLSAAVEPVAALLGAATVRLIEPALPYALAFAAGAMIYVVVEELIPESQQAGRTDLATSATVIGFTLMMILDVALG